MIAIDGFVPVHERFTLRRMLTDWLTDMELRPAAEAALLDRYIGYYQPYATSHADLEGTRRCSTRW